GTCGRPWGAEPTMCIDSPVALRAGIVAAGLAAGCASCAAAQTVALAPASMPRIGTVDTRYQSYNVEMIEVTGGRFWRPYGPHFPGPPGAAASGKKPALLASRAPTALAAPRLRKLAAALGPAYVRISGTWANSTYFAAEDAPAAPPAGFAGVLSRA